MFTFWKVTSICPDEEIYFRRYADAKEYSDTKIMPDIKRVVLWVSDGFHTHYIPEELDGFESKILECDEEWKGFAIVETPIGEFDLRRRRDHFVFARESTLETARKYIRKLERQDRKYESYERNYYEIYDAKNEEVVK